MTVRDTASGSPATAPAADAIGAELATAKKGYRPGSLESFGAILLLAIAFRGPLESFLGHPVMQSWSTVFVAICVQATPFLVLGVVVSGAIAAFVPATFFTRIMPSNATLAVPVASVCGAALPGCECGSVPISNRLIERGVRPSASLAFMLSAPAINPIVLIATAVAFTSEPNMVWARLIAGLLTAVIVGWIWERIGRPEWMKPQVPVRADGQSGWRVFLSTILGDFTQAAGFLVLGAAAAATFKTIIPAHIMESIGSSLFLSIALMAALAFILALCSEADAFVAAAFSTIPVIGKLVFLTVGPAVDVKLFAMQAGIFGRKFAVRFAPLTFVVAVVVATGVGLLFWGVVVMRGLKNGGMNTETQSIVVALLGGLLLSITLSGRFTSYVRPSFKPLLLIGGGVLVAVGVLSLILAIMADVKADKARKQAALAASERSAGKTDPAGPIHAAERSLTEHGDRSEHGDHSELGDRSELGDNSEHGDHPELGDHSQHGGADAHGHDHSTSKAPWLILLPVLVLLLVAPPALGADAVARNATSQGLAGMDVVAQEPAGSKDGAGVSGGYKFNDGSGSAEDSTGSRRTMHFPPLDPGANPPVLMKDFILRALYDADNSVKDTPVTVTGFIAPAGEGYSSGYTIARIVISCCAADANPMQLHVDGDPPFPVNTWVDAVVTAVPDTATMDNGYVPVVTLSSATSIPQPDDPYEH